MTNFEPNTSSRQPLSPAAEAFLDELHAGMGFRILSPRDGSPPILNSDYVMSFVDDATFSSGDYLFRESDALQEATGDLGLVLKDKLEDSDEADKVEALAAGRAVFISLAEGTISEELEGASMVFEADRAGVILQAAFADSNYGGRINAFPALQKQGVDYRILIGAERDDASLAHLRDVFDLLGLPSEVGSDGLHTFVMTKFIEGMEHPWSITQKQLDDWVERVARADVDISIDVGIEDSSLDNFAVDQAGRLRWVDGDLIYAREAQEGVGQHTAKIHQETLQHFVNRQS